MGPILVRQSNLVPTPERCSVVNVIDSASPIHETCDSMCSIDDHVVWGDAPITVVTLILMLMVTIVSEARATIASCSPGWTWR